MNTKFLLGIAALFPIIYFVCVAAIIFGVIWSDWIPPDNVFDRALQLHVAIVALMIALWIVYLRHVVRSTVLTREQKQAWIGLMLIVGFFSIPVYWYRYILHSKK
jgi:hypothetical protein